MRKIIEMPCLEETILVAVDIPEELSDEDEFRKVGVRDWFKKEPEKVENKFSAISRVVANCSKPLIESIKIMQKEDIPPKKASAEFGLGFTGKGKIYLVETSAEATIKVSFEWELGASQIDSR
jgi:hypothetical protein